MRQLAGALAVCALLNALRSADTPSGPAAGAPIRLNESGAVETAFLFGLGMRRLAADLALIRMVIYYGSPAADGDDHAGHDHAGHDHAHGDPAAGPYRRLGALAMRVVDLDPAYHYAAQFAAGALAFNLQRPDEALQVLHYALARDPGNRILQAYVGAIGFHKKGEPLESLRILEPVVLAPDCPTMIKNIVAFLYRRSGQPEKALRLYREILESSRDAGYRDLAARVIARIERQARLRPRAGSPRASPSGRTPRRPEDRSTPPRTR